MSEARRDGDYGLGKAVVAAFNLGLFVVAACLIAGWLWIEEKVSWGRTR